jgi:hypothetical protein
VRNKPYQDSIPAVGTVPSQPGRLPKYSYTGHMDMSPESPGAERFRVTLDLFDLGVQMYRQRMRREHPQYDEEAIEAEVQAWLFRRPGAEFGDCPGLPSSRFS